MNMIKLRSLSLRNFLSHEDTELTFHNPCRILVDGKVGAGKTAIVESIIWGLFGHARVDNRFLIRHGEDEAEVIVELFHDDAPGIVRITRNIDRAGKQKLVVEESSEEDGAFRVLTANGLRSAQAWIEKDFLHTSYLLFINSIAYPQDGAGNFISQPAAQRKDLLLEIMGAEDFDVLYNRAKDRLRLEEEMVARIGVRMQDDEETIKRSEEAKKEIVALESQIHILERRLEELSGSLLNARMVKERVASSASLVNESLSILQAKKELFERLQNQRNMLVTLVEADASEDQIKRLETEHLEFEVLKKKDSELKVLVDAHDRWEKKREELTMDHSLALTAFPDTLESEIETFKKRLEELEENSDYKCQACGVPVPRLEAAVISQREFFTSAIQVREQALEKRAKENDRFEAELKALGEEPQNVYLEYQGNLGFLEMLEKSEHEFHARKDRLKHMDEAKTELNRLIAELNVLEIELKKVSDDLELKKIDLKNALSLEQELKVREDEIAVERINIQLQNSRIRFGEYSALVHLGEEAQERLKVSELELLKHQEDRQALEAVKEAFGPRGLKTLFIDYLAPQLEERINSVLSKLSHFIVEIETQRDRVGSEGVVEGLFINIIDGDGNRFEFNSCSGGERLKIIVAISEALASFQRVGFRIIDELFIGLDNESTEEFASVLTSIQESFSQFLVISHVQSIKDLFTERIEIQKINGKSVNVSS